MLDVWVRSCSLDDGQVFTQNVKISRGQLEMTELRRILANETQIQEADQVIRFVQFGKLMRLSEWRRTVDLEELFQNARILLQVERKGEEETVWKDDQEYDAYNGNGTKQSSNQFDRSKMKYWRESGQSNGSDASFARESIKQGARTTAVDSKMRSFFDQEEIKLKSLSKKSVKEYDFHETLNMLHKCIIEAESDDVENLLAYSSQDRMKLIASQNEWSGWNSLQLSAFYSDDSLQSGRAIWRSLWRNGENMQTIAAMVTPCGKTTLMCAAEGSHVSIMSELLSKVDVNQVTFLGTALHVSCMAGQIKSTRLLLTKSPIDTQYVFFDFEKDVVNFKRYKIAELQDQEGRTAKEVATDEIKEFLTQNTKLFQEINPTNSSKMHDSFVDEAPEKPQMMRGMVNRQVFACMNGERVLEINPELCSLLFYDSLKHVPNKPKEIIPLKDVTKIREAKPPLFMSSSLFYMNISYANEDILISVKFSSTRALWLYHLNRALDYSHFVETKIQDYFSHKMQKKLKNSFLFLSILAEENTDVLSLEDKKRVTDAIASSNSAKKQLKSAKSSVVSTSSRKSMNKSGSAINNNMNNSGKTIPESTTNKHKNPAKLHQINQQYSKDYSLSGNECNEKRIDSKRLESSVTSISHQDKHHQQQLCTQQNLSSKKQSQASSSFQQSPCSQRMSLLSSSSSEPMSQQQKFLSRTISLRSFEILDILGSGAFGRVFLAKMKCQNGKPDLYALKSLKKHTLLSKNQFKYATRELNILRTCRHPFIIKLRASFQTLNYVFLALEYCRGGDLGRVIAQKNGMKESTTRFISAQVLLALEYLHSQRIVYRDMKPENILLDGDGYVKLTDFGLSKENVSPGETLRSFCGSPAYISPEILNGEGASMSTDVYGLGCVIYEMLTGSPPFLCQDVASLYQAIKTQQVDYNHLTLSHSATHLLKGMLCKKRDERLSVEEVKSHPFFKAINWEDLLARKIKVDEEILECIHSSQNNSSIFFNSPNSTIFTDPELDPFNQQGQLKIEKWSFNNEVQSQAEGGGDRQQGMLQSSGQQQYQHQHR